VTLQLVAAEGAPSFGGHGLAMEMAQLGVPTTLIPDAAIFAMMARVNKVRSRGSCAAAQQCAAARCTDVWLCFARQLLN
jgi:translation initiation factor eIF-2B subunit beta